MLLVMFNTRSQKSGSSYSLNIGCLNIWCLCIYIYIYVITIFPFSHKLLYFVWSPPWHLYIFLLANLLAFYLTYLLAFYLAYLLAFYLAVEVRQCPLGSGARGWGPAVPTAICNSRLRSGSAHWDLELAVEVRLRPLGSGLRGGGGEWGGGGGRGGGGGASNPHLAGGEKRSCLV